MWPCYLTSLSCVGLLLVACGTSPQPTSLANLTASNRAANFQELLPPAPAQLQESYQELSSSKPSSIVLNNIEFTDHPIAAFLFGNTTREELEQKVVRNFSLEFSEASPRNGKGPQVLSCGDDSEISGFLHYQNGTMVMASRGYRGTSLVGLKTDIDENPNTNNRSQRLFWFPEAYQGSEPILYDGLHLLVIFPSSPYPDGLALIRANERINNRGPIRHLPTGSYQIINVQGRISLNR